MNLTETLEIDGAIGEGGGQIVRSSLALALVTGREIVIRNIRAGRDKPGLRRQHVIAIEAAARVGNAVVEGAEFGSSRLAFRPNGVNGGVFHFRIGTAGSSTLVFQTVLPALMLAAGESRLVIEGGTHNPWAPPFDFLQRAFLPLVNQLGPRVDVQLDRFGFYPAGGGQFTATIEPAPLFQGFDLLRRGTIVERRVRALVSRIPVHVAQREVVAIVKGLGWPAECGYAEQVDSRGPGNVAFVEIESELATEIITGFGKLGVRAEDVGAEIVNEAREYLDADVPLGQHLADQWLLPLGLAVWRTKQPHSFCTMPLSLHATTHLQILEMFLGIRAEVVADGGGVRVTLRP